MTAFLGISLWVARATVVPGLVTIAVLYGVAWTTTPQLEAPAGEWAIPALAISAMVLTQFVGILLEELLVRMQWLGPEKESISVPAGIDPGGATMFELKPYEEYQGTYLLLAELRSDEDSHGHLQRALAQFFLTNNTLVSFGAGILITLALPASGQSDGNGAVLYMGLLVLFLVVTWRVARIRFGVMAKALWAARRRRLQASSSPAPIAPAPANTSS